MIPSLAKWPEAPQVGNAIYSDEYIEFWGERYVAGGWLYRGVTFMQFLARPRQYETDERYSPVLPLLGKQMRVRSRLIAAERRARKAQLQRDGEPLDLAWRQ
jgi:hypothetical protein